jgi:hypothetical protein
MGGLASYETTAKLKHTGTAGQHFHSRQYQFTAKCLAGCLFSTRAERKITICTNFSIAQHLQYLQVPGSNLIVAIARRNQKLPKQ